MSKKQQSAIPHSFAPSSTRHFPEPCGTLTGLSQPIDISGKMKISAVSRGPHSKFLFQTALIHLLYIIYHIVHIILYHFLHILTALQVGSLLISETLHTQRTHLDILSRVSAYEPKPFHYPLESMILVLAGPVFPDLPAKERRIGLSWHLCAQHFYSQAVSALLDCYNH